MPLPLSACIPVATGTPVLPGTPDLSGPPNWINPAVTGAGDIGKTLDDPRWVGTLRQSHGDGTGELAAFRALFHDDLIGEFFRRNLYLSWIIRFGPANISIGNDNLYVGFSPDGQKAVIIKVQVTSATANADTADFALKVRIRDTTTGNWQTIDNPTWLNPRVWIIQPLDNSPTVQNAPANQAIWVIQMVVPVDELVPANTKNGPTQLQNAQIKIGNTFKMWYSMSVSLPPDAGHPQGSQLQHPWPQGAAYIGDDTDPFNPPVFPNPVTTPWGNVNVGSLGHQAPCSAGVSLTMDNIGTTNPVRSQINVDKNNSFFADPANNRGSTIDPGVILARFRLANWGAVSATSPLWSDIRGLEAVPNHLPIPNNNGATLPLPAGSPASAHFITKDWLPDASQGDDVNKYKQHEHQCMLVQLSSTQDIQFVNDSVVQNMDFVSQAAPKGQHAIFQGAFLFQREAEINLLGVPPIAPDGRDVYIYVEKFNMPFAVNRGRGRRLPDIAGVEERIAVVTNVTPPSTTIGQAILTLPVVRHHVFYDTDKKTTVDKISYPILLALSSFGHIVQIDTPIFGWNQRLEGAELISPNFYKITKAPNDKPVKVSTFFEPLTQPRGAKDSGFMVQSNIGTKGDFEVVFPHEKAGLVYCSRDNDAKGFPWGNSAVFAQELGLVDAVSLIQSNFGNPGNLEVVARVKDKLFYLSGSDFSRTWSKPLEIAEGISGNPALIQSRYGNRGNFELVVPLADGGIGHYWRNNDDPALPWLQGDVFAKQLGNVDAVALIQSNIQDKAGPPQPGHLEVIARVEEDLIHLWRDDGPIFKWSDSDPVKFYEGATGIPGFIQSNYGSKGNFEVVTPSVKGGMVHLERNNDDPKTFPWKVVTTFGSGNVTAVSLLQSNFTTSTNPSIPGPGDFEVAARVDGRTALYWRHDLAPFNWEGATGFACS